MISDNYRYIGAWCYVRAVSPCHLRECWQSCFVRAVGNLHEHRYPATPLPANDCGGERGYQAGADATNPC